MTPGRNLKAIIGLAVGIGVFSALFLWWSLDSVLGHLAAAGFALLWVCVFALPEQMLGAEAWRRLFPSGNRPRYRDTLLASWMGSAINTFLPVATIGGEIAKARILHLWGRPGAETAATMIIEKTVQAVAVLLWSLVGVGCLAFTVRDGDTVAGRLVGAVLNELLHGLGPTNGQVQTGPARVHPTHRAGQLSVLRAAVHFHTQAEGVVAGHFLWVVVDDALPDFIDALAIGLEGVLGLLLVGLCRGEIDAGLSLFVVAKALEVFEDICHGSLSIGGCARGVLPFHRLPI